MSGSANVLLFCILQPCMSVLDTLLFHLSPPSCPSLPAAVVLCLQLWCCACSSSAVDLLHVPSAHVLDGDKALPHFLACFLLVLSLYTYWAFFQNFVDIKCLLSCVSCLIPNSLYSSLGLLLCPYFTSFQRLLVSLFIYWIRH